MQFHRPSTLQTVPGAMALPLLGVLVETVATGAGAAATAEAATGTTVAVDFGAEGTAVVGAGACTTAVEDATGTAMIVVGTGAFDSTAEETTCAKTPAEAEGLAAVEGATAAALVTLSSVEAPAATTLPVREPTVPSVQELDAVVQPVRRFATSEA